MGRIIKYIDLLKLNLLKPVRRRISMQMLTVLVLIVTIPLSVLGVLLIKSSYDAVKASVLRGHQELAVRAASEVGLFIQQPKDLLISTASLLGVTPTDTWKQETVLVELALNNPIFSRISSIDKNGMEIATSDLGSKLGSKVNEPGFVRAMRNESFVSDVYIKDDHTPYVRLAVPIKRLGEVIGVLFAEVNLRGMWDVVDRIRLDETGMAYVVSDKGILIAHPDKKRVLAGENMLTNTIIRRIFDSQVGSIEHFNEHRQKQLSSFAPISGLGWRMVVTQSAEEAFSFYRRMKAQSWILIILSELIAIFISILIANALVKPIKALAKSTKRVAQGKLDEHISVKREDELGELVFSFNDMIRKLRDAKNSERLSIVGKAAASIVHELKNSLVMVNTLVGLFPKKHKDARFIENFSKTMPQELERWRTMLQDLSDFSRGARIDLWFTDVDIARLIGDIRCLIEERVSQNNIELNVSVEKGLPRIKGNAQKLKQVLMNLVTNAIDAMPGGGALNLCVSMDDKINNRQKIRYVEIKIEDTGRGIPQEDYERIFEPFYTTKADGIGLGLAISRNIIQQHGGDIKAESRLNQGSCFVIILPANQTL